MQEYTVERVLVGRFPTGADLLRSVTALCQREGVRAANVSILGALRRACLGWFDARAQRYERFEIATLSELLHCGGNVSLLDGVPLPHLHAVLAVADRPCVGGHVFEGCEVFVAEYRIEVLAGPELQRMPDPTTGLQLWPAD